MKNILIICYSFPPFPGIGGRRWAKFAKILALRGYKIDVICANYNNKLKSVWLKDTIHENICIHPLSLKYPKSLQTESDTLIKKLSFHFWKNILTIFSGGTIFERTFFWKKQLLKKAKFLIEKNSIKNVIVTIPPYRLAYYSTFIKKWRPELNFIIDFRDPWTDNLSFHGFKDIKLRRLKFEQMMERKVLESADKVICVDSHTINSLSSNCEKNPDLFHLISNGFDPEDILLNEKDDKLDTITFAYTGTLYSNLEYIVFPLLDFVRKLKKESPELYKLLRFKFYGTYGLNLKEIVEDLDCFSINSPVSLEESLSIVKSADACLIFTAPDHGFSFNTKFYEYLACRKPLLVFSNTGDITEFVEQNNLGMIIDPANIEQGLLLYINNWKNKTLKYNDKFNIDNFSIVNLTDKVEALLI